MKEGTKRAKPIEERQTPKRHLQYKKLTRSKMFDEKKLGT
jgi:hypothetical protein